MSQEKKGIVREHARAVVPRQRRRRRVESQLGYAISAGMAEAAEAAEAAGMEVVQAAGRLLLHVLATCWQG